MPADWEGISSGRWVSVYRYLSLGSLRSPAALILPATRTTDRFHMRRVLLALLLVPVALSAQPRAKNVILFLADAGGLSTISAASLHGYGAPRRLYVQRMAHIGLSDTTTASQLVTDS